MINIQIVFQRESTHLCMGKHGSVFAGAVIPIRTWLLRVCHKRLECIRIAGHMSATLQLVFLQPDLLLHRFDSLHVKVTAFMGGTGDRKFSLGEAEMFHTLTFNERNGLERLGTGAQKSDRIRVAMERDQFAVRIDNGNGTIMDGFHDAPACYFKERLCAHYSSNVWREEGW